MIYIVARRRSGFWVAMPESQRKENSGSPSNEHKQVGKREEKPPYGLRAGLNDHKIIQSRGKSDLRRLKFNWTGEG